MVPAATVNVGSVAVPPEVIVFVGSVTVTEATF
jgi:hypothetical protein